jgi:DNA-binding NtrC family response regulator
VSTAQRQPRIPLFATVETPGAAGLGPLYAYNLSRGGVYVKAPGVDAEALPLGRGLDLKFALPDGGPQVTLGAEVVWLDPTLHEHAGQGALGVGLRFNPLEPGVDARITQLVAEFRYQVLVFGFDEVAFAEAAFGDLYPVVNVASVEQLVATVRSGQVGLVLLGERAGEQTTLGALAQLFDDVPEHRPHVLYCATAVSADLERLLELNPNVVFARLPIEHAELRSHVRCALEAFVAAFHMGLMSDELARALERLRRENAYLRDRFDAPNRMEGIIGTGPAMQKVFELIERVAPLSTTVLVLGETGTGKELVVGAIVARSERKDRPFIVQNCAAFSETLLDDELFGHVKGAYTGADRDRPGLFEAADGGTVFLDEIGEMPTAMQPRLLRVLENGEVRRLGEAKTRTVDVRLICATHRDLDALVKAGTFRADLLYRLRTFVISLPPLRERREDVPALAEHFLARLCARHSRASKGLSPEAKALLQANDWLGNARELAHVVERLFVLAGEGGIDAPLVREVLGLQEVAAPSLGRSLGESLEAYERELIGAALERSSGVMARAARELGMERTTLTRRAVQLGLRNKS